MYAWLIYALTSSNKTEKNELLRDYRSFRIRGLLCFQDKHVFERKCWFSL